MLVGEIRDAATASVVFQAAMTGQLVITTMHAKSSGDTIRRLLDMDIPVHHVRSGLELLVNQRLVQRQCDCVRTAQEIDPECIQCHGLGVDGRLLLAEMLPALDGRLAQSLNPQIESTEINSIAQSVGMRTIVEQGESMVRDQRLNETELKRAL